MGDFMIILLFLAISLGQVALISFGGASYQLGYGEITLTLILFIMLIRSYKNKNEIRMSRHNLIYYILWFTCFIYSFLEYFWSDQPYTALSGSLTFIFGFMAMIIANYYLTKNDKIFLVAFRILIISLFIQLLINMSDVIKIGGFSFYAAKNYATTLLGDSNNISFYFTFGTKSVITED